MNGEMRLLKLCVVKKNQKLIVTQGLNVFVA